MPLNLSRRSFLSASAQTTVGALVYSAIEVKGQNVLVQSLLSPAMAIQSGAMQPALSRLDEFIARHMSETGAPGLTLALANRDGLIRVSTYGFADVKARLKVVPETLFQIGSVSKSFVGLCLMQLRDEGKLDLNKPIVQYLPWLKISSRFEPITTHHLLTHSAGLPGAPLLLDALLQELSPAYQPGKQFLYCNTGYNILGFLIEAIDKRPYADALRARILSPLGMTASFPNITDDTRRIMAVGYEPLAAGKPYPVRGTLAEAQWIEVDIAAGSVAATPADMVKYIRMLLNRGALPKGRLVSEESFRLFTSPAINSPFRGEPGSYGYGLWVSDVEGHTRLRHTGGMVAFSSSLDVDLTSGVGAFASVNASLRGYRPVAVTRYAIDLFNASLAGKTLPAAPPPPPPAEEVKNAADYAGTYISPDQKKLVLVAEGSKLVLVHGQSRTVLERAGGDRFIVKHREFDTFLLGFVRENQKVTEAYYGDMWYAGANYSGPRTFETKPEWQSYVGHYSNDSPWYGDTRIVLRKGQLYSDGVQVLVPRPDGKFGLGDPDGPDWVGFESIVDGRAMRANISGVVFRRTFTP